MPNSLRLIGIFFLGLISAKLLASELELEIEKRFTTIVIPAPGPSHFGNLLKLALDKTVPEYGAYEFQEVQARMTENRLRAAVKSGDIDVVWTPTTPEFENKLLPVRISLLKDLDDYRILIIRAGEQSRFDGIQTLDDLRNMVGGMGSHWTDVEIMRANGLPLISTVDYQGLFKMLQAGRFDYFSRGVYQVQRELGWIPTQGLVMEQRLMLHYPAENYFFVNRANHALAARIQEGLELALADGSFDEALYSHPEHRWARAEIDNNNRHIITLESVPDTP
jgi:ABC-type amino acid transport substrate-binding protein